MKAKIDKNSYISSEVNGWTVLYHKVVHPKNAHKEPVVILVGFGDRYFDHSEEVRRLSENYPVYLVHLPGLGESQEVGAELTYPAYAIMLSTFLESIGVSECSLIAHTHTAHIAASFTGQFVTKVSKVILVAPVIKMRESVKFVMKKNIQSLEQGDLKSYAARQAIHFIPTFSESYSLKKKEIVKDYYLSLLKTREIHLNQLKAHFDRLENATNEMKHFNGIRDCATVVISGERDLMTTPEESFDFAKSCSESTFVLVDETDHSLALEKGNLLARIYKRVFENKSLKRMRGLKVLESSFLDRKYIRVTSRYTINEGGTVKLNDGRVLPVTFENISGFGCMFKVQDDFLGEEATFKNNTEKAMLDFCGLAVDVEVLQSYRDKEFRGVFSFSSFEEHEKLHSYLANIT